MTLAFLGRLQCKLWEERLVAKAFLQEGFWRMQIS